MLDRLIDRYRLPLRLTVWLAFLVALSWYGLLTANAATVEVEWTWPTLRTDGQPLPAGEIRHIVLAHGPCNATQTGLTGADGTLTVAPPATIATFERGAGPACLQAHVVDAAGLESVRVVVPFTVADAPPSSPPGAPVLVRIVVVFPTDPPEPPPADYAVVGRSTNTGTLPKNRVYDVRSYGPQWVGELSAGKPCDCADSREESWGAGTGTYCRVDGQLNETRTTYLALGSPFRAGSWTRCDHVTP